MNLSQIEKRFECVDFMATYVNYKYNPAMPKVQGIKQHIHKGLLKQDANFDQSIYGRAAYLDGDPAELARGRAPKSPTSTRTDLNPTESEAGAGGATSKGGASRRGGSGRSRQ